MLKCRRQRQQWLDKFCKLCFYYARDNANLRRYERSSICWKRRQRFLAKTESCYDDVKKYLCGSWSIDNFADSFPNVVGTSFENEVAIAISSSKWKTRGTLSSSQSEIRGVEHPDIPTSSRHACGYSESVAASEPGPSYVPTNPTESETSEPGSSSSSSAMVPSRVSGCRKTKSKPQKRIPKKRQFTIKSRTPSPQLPHQAPVIERGESNVPIMTPRNIDTILSLIPEIDSKFLPRSSFELKRVPRLIKHKKPAVSLSLIVGLSLVFPLRSRRC